MLLRLIQSVSQRVQVKGIAKVSFAMRNLLRNSSHVYTCYKNLRLKINEDSVYQWWYTVNYSSFDVLKVLERNLKPGDTFIDVGANIGFVSLNLARHVGPDGKVIAIDPQQSMPGRIGEHCQMNDIDNVVIVQEAMSDEVGEASFNVASDLGLSRLDNEKGSTFGMDPTDRYTVKKSTLDLVVSEHLGGAAPTACKVDVEGHEYQVLGGAIETVRQRKTIFVLEIIHGALKENDITLEDISRVLNEHNYTLYWIVSHYADWFRPTRQPTLERIDPANINVTRNGDIIAFPEGTSPV